MNLASKLPVNKQSMMPCSIAASFKSAKFPYGLRVLVVDDDPTCLMIIEVMLRKCDYQVSKCSRAKAALSLLRENKNGFDVVISDVHMPDMDGFKLLVHIGLEMDLPVIMMSADDSKSVVMKGVTHGACDYLVKPVRMEALRNIWQHVVRKRKHEWIDLKPSPSFDGGDRHPEDPECSSSANEGHNCKRIKEREDEEEDEAEDKDDSSSSSKKPRVTWSHELHRQFVSAVYHLGIEKAVPKKILDVMNVPGITRENVASHLQKFRLFLKKLAAQQSGGMNNSFKDNQDASYGSFSELDLHPLAAIGQVNQLPVQNLAGLQSAALGRSGNPKSSVSVPLVDQTNTYFTLDNPKLAYGNQHGNNSNNISKQMTFLHGIPSTMEQKQLAPFMGMHNSQPLIPTSSQTHNHALRQPVLAASQASSSLLDILGNHRTESIGNGFPPRGTFGIPPVMSASTLQQERNIEAANSIQRFVSSYGLLKKVNQNRTHDWALQGVDSTFDPSQHRNYMQGGLNVPPLNYAALGRKIICSNLTFSTGEDSGSHIADSLSQSMVEGLNCDTSHQQFYPLEHSQDDLLTEILTEEEDIGHRENEYAYNLDNLPA